MNTTPHFFTMLPLGGLGEIGLNCQIWQTPKSLVIIDCGLMFPEDYHLGIDVVIPRFEHIIDKKDLIKGILLTHGHEDHIGALPWLVPHIKAPIYGSVFTLALVEHKLRERNLLDKAELIPVYADTRLTLGDMTFSFIPVCHSIIEGMAIAAETPVGKIIHTGDFKIDADPLEGSGTNLEDFAAFAGKEGIKLLLSDSTNAEREGQSLGEREVLQNLSEVFAEAPGRIIVTLFSSHIQRIQEVLDLAIIHNRTVIVMGRSLTNNIELAKNLGKLRIQKQPITEVTALPPLADKDVVLLVTGSQGEPLSALARITHKEHKHISLAKGDTVVMSSRFIPSNAQAVSKLINQMYRQGAEVYDNTLRPVHASGHAYGDELRQMMRATKPEYFVPIHGEYRHLVKHARLAEAEGIPLKNILVLENGDPLTILPNSIRLEEKKHVESILVDGKGVGDVGHIILKERHILGDEGLVIVVMVLDAVNWSIHYGPEIISRGFVFEQQFDHILADAHCIVLDLYETLPANNLTLLKDRSRSALRKFFRTVLGRDPVVVPVFTEI